jgi:hypothetical protein
VSTAKDSPEVMEFMALFHKLRDRIHDDPEGLEELAAHDPELRDLCANLELTAQSMWMGKQFRRTLFAAPVDPKFVSSWRDYEGR